MATAALTIPRPDDWHLHLRDGAPMRAVVGHTAAVFGRAIVMPNLRPPVETVAQAEAYRARILEALPAGSRFEPLMTLYLTPRTTAEEVARAAASPHVHGIKLYPAGATTNSDAGVADLGGIEAVLAAMEEHDLPLLVHGESIEPGIDVFDREAVFVERQLAPLCERFPRLRVVLEHITTADAVEFVLGAPPTVAATITPQHLLLDRNALFDGGIRPHHWCLPVLKRRRHREALLRAVASGSPKLFLGTDSAPHEVGTKHAACGCAGIFSAPLALPLYAEAFEEAGALHALEGFASRHGPAFYRLPVATETVTLRREPWSVSASYPFGEGHVVPLRAGGTVAWRVESAP
ncbi:dihydroorotase [Paraliomyxa miuraensis]|uniref:dihydroorotase n=1 Tax=Paraliomyxa miuraensis TaxID=376150 RepID=UPI002256C23A|nr:dihydroorotase [Paraliomyxa miuraensis]MCX4241871.1 dihydroorotase [Paraliomyxa miuraensis]